jgi:tripartite-type tricarboxylate transporter receptor subunit TctC
MNIVKTLRGLLPAALCALSMTAMAEYPDRPIQLIVPFPPGGTTDVVARIVALKAQQLLGQTIVIQNVGGAGSIVGTEAALKSPADGYTILMSQTAFAVNPSLMKKLSYDSKADFVPIALLASHPGVIVTATSKPYNTFKEFVAYAKAHPAKVTYSSAGNGTWPHLSMAALADEVGLNMVHIPYRGTGPAKMDLLAGRVDVKIEAYATTAPSINKGDLKVLAVTGTKRIPALPNVPTVAELGWPHYQSAYWIGVIARAGTPKDAVARLETAFVDAMKDPGVVKQMDAQSIDVRGLPAKELQALTLSEMDRWAKVVKDAGVQVD